LTGINVIILYSNTIFGGKSDSGLSANQITALVGAVNFLSVFGGMTLLSVTGRRPIFVYLVGLLAISNILMGILTLNEQHTAEIIVCLLFIVLFEFSVGTILWLYLAEILHDKSIGVAVMMNWLVTLLVSAIIPSV